MSIRRILLVLALMSVPPAGAEVVVLRDGSRLRLEGAPTYQRGEIVLRLHPSGLSLRIVPAAIDVEATVQANLEAELPEAPATLTWGEDSVRPAEIVAAPLPGPASQAEAAAISDVYSRRLAALLRKQTDLRAERERLEEQFRQVERDLLLYFPDPRLRSGLGERRLLTLRALENVGRSEESVESAIRDLFLDAARQRVHLRQLSPAADDDAAPQPSPLR